MRTRVIDAPLLLGVPDDKKHGNRLLVLGGGGKRVRVVGEGGGNYPARTDTWCWHCCHPFERQPLPMPMKYDERRDVFHVRGTFCSWACMKAFNLDSTAYMKNVCANVITLFRKRCTGKLGVICCAPPRVTLKAFGGKLSIEEFRAASGQGIQYCVLPPRMILHEHAIQETHLANNKPKRQAAPDLSAVVSFKDVTTVNEPLRLKRPKPLQNNRNLMQRTMGITAFGV